ncbi:MAG: DNA alkylation repair protein [Patescibacteria group bacterium]
MSVTQIKKDLRQYASPERKKTNEWFFKTGKGEYGEHDKFLGVSNPDIRRVAKKNKDCGLKTLEKLLASKYNDERLFALIVLVEQFRKKNATKETKKEIYNVFVKNLKHVNNWNLVDISTPHIAGEYIADNKSERKTLDVLVNSDFHWHRRVCILSTWAFIKREDFSYTLKYAKKLLGDKEDLMHKAVGWMLREVWKKDSDICEKFLRENYDDLPRTTLRYAIERMEEKKRKRFLRAEF